MARAEEKTRATFWIENDLIRRCDICWKSHGFASRNEFVNRAIEQYMTTLTLDNADELLIHRLSAAIAKAADDGTVKISKGLFRYAVLEEMILHILVSQSGITSDVVGKLRAMAINNVRKTRGKISLEVIADFQNEQNQGGSLEDSRPIEERLEELLEIYQAAKEVEL